MSEYQYYEFLAIDYRLGEADQAALRQISSRARITRDGFTNSYNYGDFRGDPKKLMERWFDLFVYFANWGTHRFAIRVPKRLLDCRQLEPFLLDEETIEIIDAGDNLVIDMQSVVEGADEYDDDGAGWMPALAPLRAQFLQGDLRLFYILWMTRIPFDPDDPDAEYDDDWWFADDVTEPLPGIGPLTSELRALATFFRIDDDLLEAAGEREAPDTSIPPESVRTILAGLSDARKVDMLVRILDGDARVAADLQGLVREHYVPAKRPSPPAPRSVGELRARGLECGKVREAAEAAAAEAERRRKQKEAAAAQRVRVQALAKRGDEVWQAIEEEIERRNSNGYDAAIVLLSDMKALAAENGTVASFERKVEAIRQRHASKRKFIERLERIG